MTARCQAISILLAASSEVFAELKAEIDAGSLIPSACEPMAHLRSAIRYLQGGGA